MIFPITFAVFKCSSCRKGGFDMKGDTSVDAVRVGNETLEWTGNYMILADYVEAYIGGEQPQSSILFRQDKIEHEVKPFIANNPVPGRK